MNYDQLSDAAIAAHDRQRELPSEAHDALFNSLADRLTSSNLCLDAGVGTGSYAIPLAERGVSLVGLDVSRAMLAALKVKCGGRAPVPLVRGDLTCLPFADNVFGATLAASIFHLIPTWHVALDELMRVVYPGGLLLVNLGSTGTLPEASRLVMQQFRALLGESDTGSVGPQDVTEFHEALVVRGATEQPRIEIRFRRRVSLGDLINWQEHNVFARPSTLSQDHVSAAAASVREWARGEFGSLEMTQESERTLAFRIYETR